LRSASYGIFTPVIFPSIRPSPFFRISSMDKGPCPAGTDTLYRCEAPHSRISVLYTYMVPVKHTTKRIRPLVNPTQRCISFRNFLILTQLSVFACLAILVIFFRLKQQRKVALTAASFYFFTTAS